MNIVQDIIVVVGPSAAGKTEILNDFRGSCRIHGIPYVAKAVSDSHTILDRMRDDDRDGGRHHTHDWCKDKADGHSHLRGEPTLPFTVTSNRIPDLMYGDFFTQLATLPQTREIWFAEWSGAKNTNPPEEPASRADLSFNRIGRKLFWEEYDDSWLPRVRGIIHPITDPALRLSLNATRGIPSSCQIEYGTASWPLTEIGMKIFGEDDFDSIAATFALRGIPVFSFTNDGDGQTMQRELLLIKRELFPDKFSFVTLEGRPRQLGNRRVESEL